MPSMMKLEFTKDAEINGQAYDKGQQEEFPADAGQQIIAEGVAKEVKENNSQSKLSINTNSNSSSQSKNAGSNKGPEWSKTFGVGKNKIISVNLWERDNGQWYGAELVRQEQNDSGDWETAGRVFLPNSRALLELSDAINELFYKQKELNK